MLVSAEDGKNERLSLPGALPRSNPYNGQGLPALTGPDD